MIRSFSWRDIALLHRVRNMGVCPDSHLACTRGPHVLQDALVDLVTPGKSTCTLVVRPPDSKQLSGVGQFMHRVGQPYARLTFLGPLNAMAQPSGMRLIDALAHHAGKRGIHHLIAEVDEKHPVFENLRYCGFSIYARQRIWQLTDTPQIDSDAKDDTWRPETDADSVAIQNLYINLVPPLVQQVEPPPMRNNHNLVHWKGSDLLGYLAIEKGQKGIWAQPYYHPAVERIDDLLASLLITLSPTRHRPIFICVRSYQAGLSSSLERYGFTPRSNQAVAVKRLAASIRQRVRLPLPSYNGTQPEPTTPFTASSLPSRRNPDLPVQESY
jgi:hypothetical protein